MKPNWKTMKDLYATSPNSKVAVLYSTMSVDKETFEKLDRLYGDFFCYRPVKSQLDLRADDSTDPQTFLLVPRETGDGNPMEDKEVISILTKSRGNHGRIVLGTQSQFQFSLRTYFLYGDGSMQVEDMSEGPRLHVQFMAPSKPKTKTKPKVKKEFKQKFRMEFEDPETGDYRKWWAISQHGKKVTRSWGAAYSAGESKTEVLSSEEEAKAFVRKMVKQKNSHGYAEVDSVIS